MSKSLADQLLCEAKDRQPTADQTRAVRLAFAPCKVRVASNIYGWVVQHPVANFQVHTPGAYDDYLCQFHNGQWFTLRKPEDAAVVVRALDSIGKLQ